MRNGEFSKGVIQTLFRRAGAHCSICKKITCIPHQDPDKFHNLGEAAHINGLSDRPNLRFDKKLSAKELASTSNGIWLCQACHHIIDNDAKTYTVDVLVKIKIEHDELIVKVHESGNKLMPALVAKDGELEALRKLIKTKEELMGAKDQLYDKEINTLKFSLSMLEKERDFFREQLSKVKTEIIDLDNEDLKNALLTGGNIQEAMKIIDELDLDESEIKLGKARLIKARLFLSEGDFINAEKNFDRSLELWPCAYVALQFIKVLYYKKLNYKKVVKVAGIAIEKETHPNVLIELKAQQAEGYLKLGRAKDALESLQECLLILKSLQPSDDSIFLAQQARLEKHIGDAYKLVGNINGAFASYESSLNTYFRLTLRKDEDATTQDFAGLATAIGLLYEQNNNEREGLIHHLRAIEVIKDDRDSEKARAMIFLNTASCYLKPKNFNLEKAKDYVLKAISILEELSRENPLENMEYLVGAKCQLADISIFQNPVETDLYYSEALAMASVLYTINPVYSTMISHVKHNKAVSLLMTGRNILVGMELLDEAIVTLRSSESAPIKKVQDLSSALMLKVNFTDSIEDKTKILQEVISINAETDPMDGSILYKQRAQKLLMDLEKKIL